MEYALLVITISWKICISVKCIVSSNKVSITCRKTGVSGLKLNE